MRRFMKGCAITALILCVAGCILGMMGSRVAGRTTIAEVLDSVTGGYFGNDLTVTDEGLEEWFEDFFEGDEEFAGYSIDEVSSFAWNKEILKGDVDRYCPGSGFTRLEVEVGGCSFETKTSDDSRVYLEVKNAYQFQGYVEDDTLYITSTTGSKSWKDKTKCEITLYLPPDYWFEEASINLGAGEMKFRNLLADEAYVEVGAGQITLKSPMVDELNVSVGTGQIVLEEMMVDELDASVGMGELRADGFIDDCAYVECSMGNIQMTVEGRREDFNYQVSASMGNIDLGASSYTGFSQTKGIDNNADKDMEVECAMGNITIKFTEH